MSNTSIGIIGLGSFGNLIPSLLPAGKSLRFIGYDARDAIATTVPRAELPVVASSDIVVLAVPLSAYPAVLKELQTHLPETSLLIDVCSVKVHPEQLIRTYLPDHKNILLTHPLFGPQTASVLEGKELVVTKSGGATASRVLSFCQDELKLHVTHITGEEHDKTMAQVHALTFFIAEGLAAMDLPEIPFSTPSYQMLTDLIEFQKSHSSDLFQTVQQGNPFSGAIRQQLLDSLQRCDQILEEPQHTRRSQPADLADLREALDRIDTELIALFAKRFEVTKEVGLYKSKHHLPPVDEAREQAIFARITQKAEKTGLDPAFARKILRLTIDEVVKNHKQVQEATARPRQD